MLMLTSAAENVILPSSMVNRVRCLMPDLIKNIVLRCNTIKINLAVGNILTFHILPLNIWKTHILRAPLPLTKQVI